MSRLRVLVVGAGVSGIAAARGLLRDGHDVTVFDQRPNVTAGGGAVTIWSNGATVLDQLGVDMTGAGQPLSAVRATTSSGRPLATVDLDAMVNRLGAPVRMVPRRVLLERLLTGFPADRIHCQARAVAVIQTDEGVRVDMQDGSSVTGDLLIGADGLHSVVREVVGAPPAKPTGWCSWQGLVTLPDLAEPSVARMMIGEHGNLGLWPAGGTDLQWWFDLPWAPGFLRPQRPIEMIRRHFAGWSESGRRSARHVDRRRSGSVALPALSAPGSRRRRGRGDVARRCRAHHAADAGAGHQPGAAGHDGAAQGAVGFDAMSAALCAGTRTPAVARSKRCRG